MANIIVTEFLGPRNGGQTPAAYGPLASQVVAIGGATVATPNAMNRATGLVRVYAEADCNIVISEAPDASTGIVIPLGAGDYDHFTIDTGSQMKVACISRTVA